jgi:two-component system cell cycle sensor histidine kinase/response regulator CckA
MWLFGKKSGHRDVSQAWTLPAPEDAGPMPAEPLKTTKRGGTETIIIADDDSTVRSALSAALRRLGYRVLEASSGAQAVQVAESEAGPVHMILADVVMPSMTTDQLCSRLMAAKPGARIAFMSGYIQDDLVRRAVLHGPVPFFEKPFTLPSLARQIRDVLDDRRN